MERIRERERPQTLHYSPDIQSHSRNPKFYERKMERERQRVCEKVTERERFHDNSIEIQKIYEIERD